MRNHNLNFKMDLFDNLMIFKGSFKGVRQEQYHLFPL
jgi:hypothetical protein